MFIQGIETDDQGRVLGGHYPYLRVYEDGTTTYKWSRALTSHWGRDPDAFGETFIYFRGPSVLTPLPRGSKRQRQKEMKEIAGFMCWRFPLVHVQKEVMHNV